MHGPVNYLRECDQFLVFVRRRFPHLIDGSRCAMSRRQVVIDHNRFTFTNQFSRSTLFSLSLGHLFNQRLSFAQILWIGFRVIALLLDEAIKWFRQFRVESGVGQLIANNRLANSVDDALATAFFESFPLSLSFFAMASPIPVSMINSTSE